MEYIFEKPIGSDGRIVIPTEVRSLYKMHNNALVEIVLLPEQQGFLVRKKAYRCEVCSETKNVFAVGGICLCTACIKHMTPIKGAADANT